MEIKKVKEIPKTTKEFEMREDTKKMYETVKKLNENEIIEISDKKEEMQRIYGRLTTVKRKIKEFNIKIAKRDGKIYVQKLKIVQKVENKDINKEESKNE